MDLPQGTLLYNRYRVERQLGQGGMGAVYLAFDTSLEAWVAVKVNRHSTDQSTSQFLREAHLLASLRNPNLPRVIDYFLLDQNQYLVMDYIPGDDLARRLSQEGAPPVEQVIQWAVQLGTALSYLHSQNPPVVHRDIKPANIKLTPEGQVVLVDFGIAKAADLSQATATGAAGYTPGFAPPEQYGGSRTGPYSDQYAFAATLYTLLTGQSPVDSIQRLLGHASLAPARSLNPRVPEHVDAALQKALSIRPEDRFENVDEMVRSLTQPAYQPTLRRGEAGGGATLIGPAPTIPAQAGETRVAAPATVAQAAAAARKPGASPRGAESPGHRRDPPGRLPGHRRGIRSPGGRPQWAAEAGCRRAARDGHPPANRPADTSTPIPPAPTQRTHPGAGPAGIINGYPGSDRHSAPGAHRNSDPAAGCATHPGSGGGRQRRPDCFRQQPGRWENLPGLDDAGGGWQRRAGDRLGFHAPDERGRR